MATSTFDGDWQADAQAAALANHLGKVSLSGATQGQPRARDGLPQKFALRELEIQKTIGEAWDQGRALGRTAGWACGRKLGNVSVCARTRGRYRAMCAAGRCVCECVCVCNGSRSTASLRPPRRQIYTWSRRWVLCDVTKLERGALKMI